MRVLHYARIKSLLFIFLLVQISSVGAVNWVVLQATEPKKVIHRPFVFVQYSYTRDLGRDISVGPNAGKRASASTIAPWFEENSKFHFRRARIGIRGNFTGVMRNKFTQKMNYFFLTELAPNLITYDFLGDSQRAIALDHFSLTANHIPGARLRFGLFKTPGLEEVYQGIVAQDYIEFTDFAAREVLERFATGNNRATPSGGTNGNTGTPVKQSSGFNGARDWGVQVFNSFKDSDWDYTYSFMLGRGRGIDESAGANKALEQYYYLSAEQDLAGGKGPWKHGIKYYAWLQNGVRIFESDPLKTEYNRKRYGIGIRAQGALFGLKAKQRLDLALMFADGMVFIAPAGSVKGGNLMYAAQQNNRSRAISLDYGRFLTKHWEVMIRLEKHELLYKTDGVIWTKGDARTIDAVTYGLQYSYTPKQKLAINYINRTVTAPYEFNAVVQDVVASVGDRYSVQYTWIF